MTSKPRGGIRDTPFSYSKKPHSAGHQEKGAKMAPAADPGAPKQSKEREGRGASLAICPALALVENRTLVRVPAAAASA